MDEFPIRESHGSLWKKLCDHYAKVVDPVAKEFGGENLDDDILHRMKNMLSKFHRGRMVQNGEGIGILSVQSIGETSTQLSLNSFHSVGFANSALSVGVPRLKYLIDAFLSRK